MTKEEKEIRKKLIMLLNVHVEADDITDISNLAFQIIQLFINNGWRKYGNSKD